MRIPDSHHFTRRRFLAVLPALLMLPALRNPTALWSSAGRVKPVGGDPQINRAVQRFRESLRA